MHTTYARTLVLTHAAQENGRTLFAGDLYVGPLLQTSVQLTRPAMLQWLAAIDPAARPAAAQAMDELAAFPTILMRQIVLSPSQKTARKIASERAMELR